MAGDKLNQGMVRIDPSSPVYQEVARLYRIALEMRPGGKDLWNGELYARFDDKWGGLGRDGTMRLNQHLALDQLTGGDLSDNPQRQSDALLTVLHESKHASVEFDAVQEPNALRQPQSIGFDEGLTELGSLDDFEEFARRAGYDGGPDPQPEYVGAVHASEELLKRAASSDVERAELLHSTLGRPVMMRWDFVADRIVRNELTNVVPVDPDHQRAARAHLVNQMAVGEWAVAHDRPESGPLVAAQTNTALNRAVAEIRTHYQQKPGESFPAKVPNQAAAIAAKVQGEHQRAIARTDRSERSGELRFLGGQAPAGGAVRRVPQLGDGARGAGTPDGGRPAAVRGTAGERGPSGPRR